MTQYVGTHNNLSINFGFVGSLYRTKVPRQFLQHVVTEINVFPLYTISIHVCIFRRMEDFVSENGQ